MSKKKFILIYSLLILVFLAVRVDAQESTFSFMYGMEYRYEHASESAVLQEIKPISLSIAYVLDRWSLWSELSYFSKFSGNDSLSVRRDRYDLLAGLRFHPIAFGKWYPYLMGGLGASQEQIRTQLLSSAQNTKSDLTGVYSMGVGVGGRLFEVLSTGLEARLLGGHGLVPNPLTSFILRIGIEI